VSTYFSPQLNRPEELQKQGKLNALKYIKWGEQQVFIGGQQAGLTWPHGAEVRNRKPGWYALPWYRGRPAQLFFASAYGERHIHKYSPKPLIADKRLYFLSPVEGISHELMAAVMNSSITAFFTEIVGRVTLGDGALELTVEDARDYLLVPDVRQFDQSAREAIETAFKPLLTRPIGSIFEEVKQPDRQVLDHAILQAMGLNPVEWLPHLYEGLTTLVRQRIQLGQMRSQSRRSRPQKAASRVAEEVLQDLLPHGPAKFPDEFLSPQAQSDLFREIPLPTARLSYKGHSFGKEELATAAGQTFYATTKFEARYLLLAQAAGQAVARLPEKPVEVSRTVNTYLQYLRNLREQLHHAYFARTLDQAAAERFVVEVWRKFDLPNLEE
jgi:hypothetical protein